MSSDIEEIAPKLSSRLEAIAFASDEAITIAKKPLPNDTGCEFIPLHSPEHNKMSRSKLMKSSDNVPNNVNAGNGGGGVDGGAVNQSFSTSESIASVHVDAGTNNDDDDDDDVNENISDDTSLASSIVVRRNSVTMTKPNENDVKAPTSTSTTIKKKHLWHGASLVVWPAVDLNSLIQQTIIRCTDTCDGKQNIQTATVDATSDFIEYNNFVMCPRLRGSNEIIL